MGSLAVSIKSLEISHAEARERTEEAKQEAADERERHKTTKMKLASGEGRAQVQD